MYFPRGGQNAEGQLIAEIGSAKKTLDVAITKLRMQFFASVISVAKNLCVCAYPDVYRIVFDPPPLFPTAFAAWCDRTAG